MPKKRTSGMESHALKCRVSLAARYAALQTLAGPLLCELMAPKVRDSQAPHYVTTRRDSGAGDSASADRRSSGSEASAMPDSLPVAGVDTDWREFRARLVAGSKTKATPPADSTDEAGPSGQAETSHWAHTIPRPEQGCLLIAHPLMFVQQQTYFNQVRLSCSQHSCPLSRPQTCAFGFSMLRAASRLQLFTL